MTGAPGDAHGGQVDQCSVKEDAVSVGLLLTAVTKRWYVVLIGLLCGAAALVGMSRDTGVFWTRVEVIFVEPGTDLVASRDGTLETRVAFASIVEHEVNSSDVVARLSSSNATLAGAGVREGYAVTVPSGGGQWTSSFNRPLLAVEVVGRSADEVTAVLDGLLAQIESVAIDLQDQRGVSPERRILPERVAEDTAIYYQGPTRSGQARGAAAVGAVTGLVTFAAVTVLERGDRTRRRRETPTGAVPQNSAAAPLRVP